jgi:hypothetical protein
MKSTLESRGGVTESLQASWRHLKDVFLASTPSAAWQSFKKLVEVLPVWSLVVAGVLLGALVLNQSVVVIAISMVAVLLAIHHTVKHAVLAALDERER